MTRTPIPNCPQEDKTIRDRAWTDEQRLGPQIVCCVCGDPCSIYSPVCAECGRVALQTIGATP